ncbi:MAG: hypothetical protein JSV16_06510 [Candidatus Hydrogenedentota bacterium]|nr:MAG: hypothetical protein JSV16_06510 [Candidatus Hydrogenedentota bacterium]
MEPTRKGMLLSTAEGEVKRDGEHAVIDADKCMRCAACVGEPGGRVMARAD